MNRIPWRDTKRGNHMKNSIRLIALLAIGSGGLASFTTGCSGTATRQSTGEYVDDATITAKVKSALTGDPRTKGHQINVETREGAVQLSGFVRAAELVSRAGRVTAGVTGVLTVHNNIAVR